MKIKQLIVELQKIEKESPNANVSVAMYDSSSNYGLYSTENIGIELRNENENEVYLKIDINDPYKKRM